MAQALVLGVGNILMQDEGVGVRALEWLQAHYIFPTPPIGQDAPSTGDDLNQAGILSNGIRQAGGLADNGVGQAHSVSRHEVTLIDGGTMGLDLLHYLQGIDHLLILDAVDSNQAPGALVTLTGSDVPTFLSLKISPHQIGVQDLLATAQLLGYTPPEVVILGVQPAWLNVGTEMSPTVTAQVEPLARLAASQLQAWGYQPILLKS